MSTEDNKFPHDSQLSELYSQTEREQPPKHLDDAILAAARRETHSRPHPAFSPFSSNWRVPVSLAAVLVLTVSIVNLVKDDEAFINDIDEIGAATSEPAEATDLMIRELKDKTKKTERLTEEIHQRKQEKQRQVEAESQSAFMSPAAPAAKPSIKKEQPIDSIGEDIMTGQAQINDSEGLAAARRHKPPEVNLSSAPAGTIVPSIKLISRLRKEGDITEASNAADAYIKHYFGEKLDGVSNTNIKPSEDDIKAIIKELRLLKRNEDADKLKKLYFK